MVHRGREAAAAVLGDVARDAAPAGQPAEPAAASAGEAQAVGTGLLGRLGQSLAPGQGAGVCASMDRFIYACTRPAGLTSAVSIAPQVLGSIRALLRHSLQML